MSPARSAVSMQQISSILLLLFCFVPLFCKVRLMVMTFMILQIRLHWLESRVISQCCNWPIRPSPPPPLVESNHHRILVLTTRNRREGEKGRISMCRANMPINHLLLMVACSSTLSSGGSSRPERRGARSDT